MIMPTQVYSSSALRAESTRYQQIGRLGMKNCVNPAGEIT